MVSCASDTGYWEHTKADTASSSTPASSNSVCIPCTFMSRRWAGYCNRSEFFPGWAEGERFLDLRWGSLKFESSSMVRCNVSDVFPSRDHTLRKWWNTQEMSPCGHTRKQFMRAAEATSCTPAWGCCDGSSTTSRTCANRETSACSSSDTRTGSSTSMANGAGESGSDCNCTDLSNLCMICRYGNSPFRVFAHDALHTYAWSNKIDA